MRKLFKCSSAARADVLPEAVDLAPTLAIAILTPASTTMTDHKKLELKKDFPILKVRSIVVEHDKVPLRQYQPLQVSQTRGHLLLLVIFHGCDMSASTDSWTRISPFAK